jgi:lipopolysaccharide transport system permease protein
MNAAIRDATRFWSVIWRQRRMILQMVRREVVGRYRGTILGFAWAVFQPLMMLLVYTFAFNVVFRSRWTGETSGGEEINFAVAMFLGFIIYTLFTDTINRAPSLVVGHVNYVKKVVFPLEILAPVAIGVTLFNAAVAFLLWVGLFSVIHHAMPWTILLLPLVLFPLVLMSAGVAWFFASLGVFVRDLGQVVSLVTMSLLFLSPIFYPASAIPEPFRGWMNANPLTGIIEEARKVAISGVLPDWGLLSLNLLLGMALAHLGFLWFVRTRSGFADVL